MSFPFLKSRGSALWKRIRADESTRLRLKYDTYYHIFDKQEGTRVFKDGKEFIMLSSNDYLGLSNHPKIKEAGIEAIQKWGSSTTGARLANGGRIFHRELEEKLAAFLGKEACHVFSAGYLACASAITGFADRKDLILADKNLHSSLWSGIQLSGARCERFAHNNPAHASEILSDEGADTNIFVLEGVYSMEGHIAKLPAFVEIAREHNAFVILDDAHGFGTLGKTGAGAGEEQGVQEEIDVYFATFAKSMASTGAFIASDKEIIDFLKYNMRSQVFAKSLQMQLVEGILKRLEILRSKPEIKQKLWDNVNKLQSGLKDRGFDIGSTQSCVTPVYLKGSIPEAFALVKDLRENYKIFCSIVVYPVIPKGLILLRLIPTASHNFKDIEETLEAFSSIRDRLVSGVYKKISEKLM